mgnify:FL=1
MPRKGYSSITVPESLDERISDFIENRGKSVSNKSQAISLAWENFEKINSPSNGKIVQIGHHKIGGNNPIFIIAEIGINHNGDIQIAKDLIDIAVDSGCHAVKFQKRTIEVVYSKEELDKPRESPWGDSNRDQKHGLEFSEEEFLEIDNHCKKRGIVWFASPWDEDSVDFLEKFEPPCYKVASASLTDKQLLLKMKSTGKPIILSTGMSTMKEIMKAVDLLGQENLVILHCTSAYPCKEGELNLEMIRTLKGIFSCPVGYSGHEPGVWPSLAAAVAGATVIERHITLDRTMYGSDQSASLEKKGISIVCEMCSKVPDWMGDGIKVVYDREKPIIEKLRRINTL